MIVVDTSIIAHFWFPSDHTERCERLFQWDPEWVAQLLNSIEIKTEPIESS